MTASLPPAGDAGRRVDVAGIAVLAAVAAILGAVSDGAATGVEGLDAFYRAVLAATVTVAAAWVSPSVLVVAGAAVYGTFAGVRPSVAIVVIAMIGIALALWPRELPRALAGAMLALTALSLPSFGFWGAPSLVAGGALGAVVVAALWGWGVLRRHRRVTFAVAGAVLVVVGGLCGVAGASALAARAPLEDAIDRSRAGLEAIRNGDVDRGIELLEQAAGEFERGGDRSDNFVARAARIVPVVSQHQRMLADASEAGARLAASAAREAASADVDRLRVVNGAFDLTVLDDLGAAVDRSLVSVVEAERIVVSADSEWLVPQLAGRVDDLLGELQDARQDLELSRDVIEVTPWLLGEDAPRRYFVILASPAETRELGGFMGAFATLVVEGGGFRLETSGSASRDLANALLALDDKPVLSDPESYPLHYRRYDLERFPQNLTGTPDLPTVARAVADLYPQYPGGAPVDGVVYMDPVALGALVRLSGPVAVEGRDGLLRPGEVDPYLLRGQYIEFPEVDERSDVLDAILETTVTQLFAGSLPEPRVMFDTLQGPVQGNHLRVHVFDDAAQQLVDDIGLGGRLVAPAGDYIALRQANGGQNKLDAYLERDVTVDVVADPASGSVRTVVTAAFTSTARGDLPDYVDANRRGLPEGTNQILVSLYSAVPVESVVVDGVATPVQPSVEYGLRRANFFIEVPRGETVTVEARLVGFLEPSDTYELFVDHQPLAVDDTMTVIVRDAASFEISGPEAPPDVDRAEFVLDRPASIVATLDR